DFFSKKENKKYKSLKNVLKEMNIIYETNELSGYVYLEDKDTLRFVKVNKQRQPKDNTFTLTNKGSDEEKEYK
mgnify:CR=1